MYTSIPFTYTTLATTNLVQIGGASESTKIAGAQFINTAAYTIYVKLYWAPQGVTPVVGTSVPSMTIGVPAPVSTTAPGQFEANLSNPLLGNGILWMWVTKSPGASDTTATSAGDGILTLFIQ